MELMRWSPDRSVQAIASAYTGPGRVDGQEIPDQAPGQQHVVAEPPGPLDRFLPERAPCLRLAGEEMRAAQRPKGSAEQPLVAQPAGDLDRLVSKLPCGG